MVFFNLLIENWSKVINYNQNKIKFRSKSRLSTQICRWVLNRTKIDDQYWPVWNPNCRRFDAGSIIALAYYGANTKFHKHQEFSNTLADSKIFFLGPILICYYYARMCGEDLVSYVTNKYVPQKKQKKAERIRIV